jgi:hypothetical protein
MRSISGIYNAKINELYNVESGLYLVQGIKKDKQSEFERSIRGKGKGSNGSYLMYDQKVEIAILKLYVYDLKKTIFIDISELLKYKYGKKRFTKGFLAKVIDEMPKKIKVISINGTWDIADYDNLIL